VKAPQPIKASFKGWSGEAAFPDAVFINMDVSRLVMAKTIHPVAQRRLGDSSHPLRHLGWKATRRKRP
jgi:hypothetical protein